MNRIVDIATDGRHLSVHRGFLCLEERRQEVGRVALDDIAAVIVHAHGVTYSNNLLTALAERNILLVICSSNHAPVSLFWPLAGHHGQGARMQAQWRASKPLMKQLWRTIVTAKIRTQGAVLSGFALRSGGLDALARKVKSGDPENVEAQASRRYWPLLFGKDFRRDREAEGINAMLNYGYTVIRATVARSVVAAGLHPTAGIHHKHRGNAFALADDLMEPFRPYVDARVKGLADAGHDEVCPDVKQALAALTALDLPTGSGVSPLSVCAQRLAVSLAKSFELGKAQPDLPLPPSDIEVAALREAVPSG